MLSVPDSLQIRLKELISKRKDLWERFEQNPTEIHLAAELKVLDDQIAECNQQIRHHVQTPDLATPNVGPMNRQVAAPKSHFHIRWSSGNLDWERHSTSADAEAAARQLVRPGEEYTIEDGDETCRSCQAVRRNIPNRAAK